MTSDLRIALTTSLNDRLTGPLKRHMEDLEQTMVRSSQKIANVAKQTDRLGQGAGATKLKGEMQAVGQAADRAQRETKKLADEMGRFPNLAKGITNAVVALTAARAVLAEPMKRAADYELDLARLSNIAYSDRNTVAGRKEGQREMDKSIRTATVEGVTRDDALVGLKTLIGAGVNRKDAMDMLPGLAKFSMAGEASMSDVANIAVKAQQTYGIKAGEMPAALQMALTAGKEGQFEFKDMAHWLPEQMAISKNMLGMQGLSDLPTLLTANQFAARSAGSNNAAGNNLVNFLGKINSVDTGNDAKKLGIDLTGTLVKARSEGMNPIDAFIGLMRKTADQDPAYKNLQGKLQKTQESGDKKGELQTLTAMRDLMMGKSIGKMVQDRQALLGLLGIMNDPEGFNAMRTKIRKSEGGVDVDQQTLMATAAMKNQQGENAMLDRQFDALQGVNNQLGDFQVQLAKLSAEYPNLAAGFEAVKLAAYAAATALTGISILNRLKPTPAPPTTPPVTTPPVVTPGAPGAGAGAGGAMSTLSKLGTLARAGLSAANPLFLIEALTQPSAEDIAKLREMDRRKSGYRGKNFVDPRALARGEGPEGLKAKDEANQRVNFERLLASLDKTISTLNQANTRPISVQIDGREIAASVNQNNTSQARRN